MKFLSINTIVCTIFLILFPVTVVHADEPQYEIGLRANVLLGDGKPANDILGVGLIGRHYRDNGWFVGGNVDIYAYDFERPASFLGISQDPNVDVIDADATSTVLAGFMGREYGDAGASWRWFWSMGLGVGFGDVDDVSGPIDGGGAFDLQFDRGTEIHLQGAFGGTWYFATHWSASFTGRVEHHFMDVTITDQVSGAKTSISSQSPVGASLSLNYRF